MLMHVPGLDTKLNRMLCSQPFREFGRIGAAPPASRPASPCTPLNLDVSEMGLFSRPLRTDSDRPLRPNILLRP